MKIPKYINIDPLSCSPFQLRERMRAFVDHSPVLEWFVEEHGKLVTNTDGSSTQMLPRQGILEGDEFHLVHERKGRLVVFVLSSPSVFRACKDFASSEGATLSTELDWSDAADQNTPAEQDEALNP